MSTTTTAKMTIPIARPFVGKEEEEAVVQALRSGWLSQGPACGEFETKFAEYVGAKHCRRRFFLHHGTASGDGRGRH